jgi:hypothetical protein
MSNRGRNQWNQGSGHHGGHNTPKGGRGQSQPRAPSETRSTTGSATSKKGRGKKGKKHNKENANPQNRPANGNNDNKPLTRSEVTQLFTQMLKTGGPRKKSHNQQDPEARDNDRGNDVDVNKDDIIRQDFAYNQKNNDNKPWSNYPFALPPQFNSTILFRAREALERVNSKTRLGYAGPSWDLGVLECYDGISNNEEPNFLSCDFVNPAYMKHSAKHFVGRLVSKDTPSEWIPKWQSFVYAPPNTILSKTTKAEGGVDAKKVPISLAEARQNWIDYAKGKAIPGTQSPLQTTQVKQVHAKFWFYREEFIDFENRDRDTIHAKFSSIKFSGRIGMLFPIKPIVLEETDALYYWDETSDRIGWGVVSRIGTKLDPEDVPTTWAALQSRIGRYILLTNVWSANSTDPFEVHVTKNDLRYLYQKVCEITNGDMIVSVRRGCHGYGRLCVLHKTITVDPRDEAFRTDATVPNQDSIDLTVTQIFMCSKSLTKDNFTRKPLTEPWKNDGMRFEEKNLCSILQNFINSVILCMKNEGYKNVMVDYWNTSGKESFRPRTMTYPIDSKWTTENIKTLMVLMFSTGYELIFQRGACKVACKERTIRLSYLMTNYRHWFVSTKCMADDVFVKDFEAKKKSEAPNFASFDGMMAQYTNTSGGSRYQPTNFLSPPQFEEPDAKVILTKVPTATNVVPDFSAVNQKHAAQQARVQEKMYANILAYVQPIVENWRKRNVAVADAEGESKNNSDGSLDPNVELYRKKMAYEVYAKVHEDGMLSITDAFMYEYQRWSVAADAATLAYFEAEKRLIT